MKKTFTTLLLAIVIILAVVIFMKLQGPNLGRYEAPREPSIRMEPPHRMLVVEAKGAPAKMAHRAFGLLMKTYYGLKGVPKGGPFMAAPRGRWPVSDSVPQTEWVGRYAIPIPDSIHDVKLPEAPPGFTIQITTWEYGNVAEILHIGPYSDEKATVERLKNFVRDKGFRIVGEHEEVYLKGPGMFFKGNPKHYYTIIRYQVAKADSTAKAPDTVHGN